MTTNEKIARRKLSLLQLAQDLANVSRACKVMGSPNRVSAEIEQAILDHALVGRSRVS
jgi:hypothetical protein